MPSNSTTNPLPKQILIRGRLFGANLNTILYQETGVRFKVKCQVWLGGLSGSLSIANTSRTVSLLDLSLEKTNSIINLESNRNIKITQMPTQKFMLQPCLIKIYLP